MAKTSYTAGNVVQWTNGTGSDVASGAVVTIGSYGHGVATVAIANGATGSVAVSGVHKLTKYATSNALTQGQKVWWDATNGCMNVPSNGDTFIGYAELAASATATTAYIRLAPFSDELRTGVVGATSSATAITLTASTLKPVHAIIASAAGTQAVAVPAAADCAGYQFTLRKTGTAGAVTLTPAAGTLAGGATHAACDAQNDFATFVAIGADWVLLSSVIA